ncbi:MAG: dockerin type I repeat-containing protein [candidate division Zixibacteria bacterium]|nr:dockerin type I repeat-containing protein [candidate division Zixibacteria bacterium]
MLDKSSLDGVLPDYVLAGGTAICHDCQPNTGGGGFQNSNFIDFFEWTVSFDSSGFFCIDSSFFPPNVRWLVNHADGSLSVPLWSGGGGDLSVGGTRTEAYCVNILESDCCATPGDANHDGMVNIADASYLVSRIFGSGAPAACCREADPNGDGRMNIADITYMVRRIFAGGSAPICGGPVGNC